MNADLNLIDAAFTGNRYTNFGSMSNFTNTSSSFKMGGYGSAWTITPSKTGKVRVRITGVAIAFTNTAGSFRINYGTGTAPVAAAAVTGTAGNTSNYVATVAPSAGTATIDAPFTVEFEVTGLTLATPYWFDFASNSSDNVSQITIAPRSVIIEEFYA